MGTTGKETYYYTQRGSNGVLMEQESRRILHPSDLIFKCWVQANRKPRKLAIDIFHVTEGRIITNTIEGRQEIEQENHRE